MWQGSDAEADGSVEELTLLVAVLYLLPFICNCLCQRSYFFRTILYELKSLEKFLNCSWKFPFAERWRNIFILYSEQYWTVKWQELQEKPRHASLVSLPTHRNCLGEKPFKLTDSPPGRVRLPLWIPTALFVQIWVIPGSLASAHLGNWGPLRGCG